MKKITYVSSTFETLDVLLIKDSYVDTKYAHLNPNDVVTINLPDDFEELRLVSNSRKTQDICFADSDNNVTM